MTPKHPNSPAFFLGIDVGKKDLFCHLITQDSPVSQRYENSPAGIASLIQWLASTIGNAPGMACLEQTGIYGKAVTKALASREKLEVFVVNPQRIKAYSQRKLRRNKSDSADAKLIAQFIQAEHPELHPWSTQSADREQITELSRYAESLTKDSARLKVRCESTSDKSILRSLKRRISLQEKEVKELRKTISQLIKNNPALNAQKLLLESIPGIGQVCSQTLIAELPDLSQFKDARQLAAWAGLTPKHFVSGTSGRTRTPITKIGSAIIRRNLFMPAMTSRVHNPILKDFGDRLQENGKTPKQVIVAIMRKLLHIIYGVLKSGQPFNPNKRGFMPPLSS